MATGSSPGGAGHGAKEVVVEGVPATSEQESSEQKREINPTASREEEAIRSLEALHARACGLLDDAVRRRVRNDIERLYMHFMKMEVRDILALLRSSYSPLQLHDRHRSPWYPWWAFGVFIHICTRFLQIAELRSRFPCLLNIALLRLQRSYPSIGMKFSVEMVRRCHFLEHAGRYGHLYSCLSSDIELPPQVAEVGAAPLVGMDRPINKLFRWLVLREKSNYRSLSVLSIVGSAGMGKTALAMDLHDRLKCQPTGGRYSFHCNVMAQMSRRGEDERYKILLQDILSKISDLAAPAEPSDHSRRPTTMGLLATHVSKCLQNKRYFICIDDMRDASDWYKINHAFPNNNLGSRILITTRDESIARPFDYYMLAYQMKPLNRLDSERLLLTRAFGSQLDGAYPGMTPSFYGLLDACGGVPLFIILLADLWKQQHLQKMKESREEANRYDVLRRALYHNFGNHILYLFFFEVEIHYEMVMILLYLSMFPHGHKFEKDSLFTKWTYEGLADSTYEAELYFSQLIDWDIITSTTVNSKSNPDEAEAWLLNMNHFMQYFLASKSAEIGFAFTNAMPNIEAASTSRRLVVHDPVTTTLPQKIDLSEVHFLSVLGAVDGVPLDKFVFLVVLDLEGWQNLTDDVLRQLCTNKMTLLQYLSVGKTQVSKIPHEIKNMCSLRALDISYTKINELPPELFELECLRDMLLRGTKIRELPRQIVRRKDTLSSIILGGEGTTIMVPDNIRHMWNLEKLDTIDMSQQHPSFMKALHSLPYLNSLGMTWSIHQSTSRSYREALLSFMGKWRKLRSLTIHCGLGCSMDFLGSLTDPPQDLEKFKVTMGRFASLPKWINKVGLSFLQITICRQGADNMKVLGALKSLRCLILGLDFIPEEVITIGNDGFRFLQRFSVDCPMPWLSFSAGAMRKLRYLQLKFRSTPARKSDVPSGLENLETLTEVALCYLERYTNSPSVKMTVEAVKKQVANHPNPVDLFINGTEHNVEYVEVVETENSDATQSGIHAQVKDVAPAVNEELKIQSTCEIEEVLSDA